MHNGYLKHKACLFQLSIVLFALSMFLPQTASCDDFPGKGDRFAWSSALPHYNLANKYLEHGKIDEAVENYEEAIYRYEYDPDFYVNYGVALRKRENYKGAEDAFKKAIELRPSDWQSWGNLANAYLKQNKLEQTISCFQKAMKVSPPPPAAEKAAMLKDIADINKILSMNKDRQKLAGQAPAKASANQQAPGNGSGTKAAGTGNGGKSSAGVSGGGKAQLNLNHTSGASAGKESNAAGQAASEADLKKSGWDWVY